MLIFLFKNFWIVLILMTCINAFILKVKSKKYIAHDPSLKTGYDKLIKAELVYWNIPWIIMGIGNLSSFTNNPTDYFNTHSNNPFVLTFYFSIVILWTLGTRWIYLKNGAAFLEKHPGSFRGERFGSSLNLTATKIKICWGIITGLFFIRLIIFFLNYFPS
jgi:magnesium-transporting ATPase (P-type)